MPGMKTSELKKEILGGDGNEGVVKVVGSGPDTRKWVSLSPAEQLEILKRFETTASYPGTETKKYEVDGQKRSA